METSALIICLMQGVCCVYVYIFLRCKGKSHLPVETGACDFIINFPLDDSSSVLSAKKGKGYYNS